MDRTSLDTNGLLYRRAVYLTLHDVNSHLISNGQTIVDYHDSLPQFSHFSDVETAEDIAVRNRNRLLETETSYEPNQLERCVQTVGDLNTDQRFVYDRVMAAVLPDGIATSEPHRPGKLFVLDGPGGTGKSFLLEKLLGCIRHAGCIALAVARSGIAAQLLTSGRTAHSTFRLPLDPDETSTCNFGVRSKEAALLMKTSLIVWDEAPMTHRYQCEALDRTLRDLLKRDLPFGGITMLLSGDFRQTLPVTPRAGPAEVISASLKRSPLWRHFENMRVQTATNPESAQAAQDFADYLLRVGDGRHAVVNELGSDYVRIPTDMVLDVSSLRTVDNGEGPPQDLTPQKLSLLIGEV